MMILNFRYFAQKALDFKLSTKAKKMTNVFIVFVIGQFTSLVVYAFLLLGNNIRDYYV